MNLVVNQALKAKPINVSLMAEVSDVLNLVVNTVRLTLPINV